MELCTTRSLSNPALNPHLLSSHTSGFRFDSSIPLKKRIHFFGVLSHTSTLLKATSDETSSSGPSKFSWDTSDPVVTLEDVPSVDNDLTLDKVSPVNQSVYNETKEPEPPEDESSSSESMQSINEFLEKLNIKLDSEDPYPIFLYGGGALVTLWLLSAIVGAIDSVPVFPKVMEIVGLGYSLWFTSRYLLFKKNREELLAKIDELKQEILGSGDN